MSTGIYNEAARRRIDAAVHWAEQQMRSGTGRSVSRDVWAGGRHRFRLKSVHRDYLTCRTWDGTTEGDTDVYVAMPVEIQSRLLDGKTVEYGSETIAYVWTGDQARTLTPAVGSAENQVIVPTYQVAVSTYVGDEIYATRPVGGTGVTVSGNSVSWMDTAARVWARATS